MRVSSVLVPALISTCLGGTAIAGETITLEDETDRTSYSLGHQIGIDLKNQETSLDRDALLRGLTDGQSGAEPLMKPEEMTALLAEVKQRIIAERREKRKGESEAKKQASILFLEENKSKPGVQVTDSGLQYRVIEEGSGKHPGPTDSVRVHYRGKTIEGTEFDSSMTMSRAQAASASDIRRVSSTLSMPQSYLA